MKTYFRFISAITVFLFFVTACKSVPEKNKEIAVTAQPEEKISLLFAGDIMAHSENFVMEDYYKIWKDVKNTIQEPDLAFGNIESPVDNTIPYSSYPAFNMKNEYADAIIDAGFDVFSVVNNHTNDQGLSGIINTKKWIDNTEKTSLESGKPVYFSGINDTDEGKITFKIIQSNNWKIIFCAVTELLNRNICKNRLNFYDFNDEGRKNLLNNVKKIREENPCDLFILSIHTSEPEYVKKVSSQRKNFYHTLLQNGIDVVWANHPHVVREVEVIGNNETGRLTKLIMYGNGNTISGQRRNPQLKKPETPRDDTGDGLLYLISFKKNENGDKIYIDEHKMHYITTYINTAYEFILKNLDDEFIEYLNNIKRTDWAEYISARKKITEKTKETIIWQ